MKDPRFLILCTNRTGSTVLRQTINNHPDLTVEGEILLFDDDGYFSKIRSKLCKGIYPQFDSVSLDHERDLIPLIISAFEKFNGFKIQICAKQIHKTNSAWVYLAHMPDLKIINIRSFYEPLEVPDIGNPFNDASNPARCCFCESRHGDWG